MLGIIGAMIEEVLHLKEAMEDVEIRTIATMDFYQGRLKGLDVVVVRSGIGKVNAAICTQILIDQYNVRRIINTGIAGSLRSSIDIGDIVLSRDAMQHDMDATGFGYKVGQIPQMEESVFKGDRNMIYMADMCCRKVIPQPSVRDGANLKLYKSPIPPWEEGVLTRIRQVFMAAACFAIFSFSLTLMYREEVWP